MQTGFFEPLDELKLSLDRFYLVVANPMRTRGLSLFPVIRPFDLKKWGLPWLVTHITVPDASVAGQMVAEAVAVAGARAAGDGTPRMVVVLTGDGDLEDMSRLGPEDVREYLRALNVPLRVWTIGEHAGSSGWGPGVDVSSARDLSRASRQLVKELRRQWVVWIEGQHLPSAVELAPDATGFDLAGASDSPSR
jgi:hypothetical protein